MDRRERIRELWEQRRKLNHRIDLIDQETRALHLEQSREDHPCECVRLNGDIGVHCMATAESKRRNTFGIGLVRELLSADKDCVLCGGSGGAK